jgi:hypothetical protein
MRLKSRDRFVPYGPQLMLAEIGMKKPITGTFNDVVRAFSQIVAKNPALAQKQGWPTDLVEQENWIERRECLRLIAGGYEKFVEMEGVSPPSRLGGMSRNSQRGDVVAAKASPTLTGAAIWKDMLQGSKPVARDEAERRAAICVDCPQNKKGSFKDWFVASVAKGLTELVAMMNSQNLTTSRDKELGTCAACSCPMAAKVWVPLEVIKKHMPSGDVAKLDPRCWITK